MSSTQPLDPTLLLAYGAAKEDIRLWLVDLESIRIAAQVQYDYADGSPYIYIPLMLSKSEYPPEFIRDLARVGIVLQGNFNCLMGEAPATIGLACAIVSSDKDSYLNTGRGLSVKSMQSLGYRWLYIGGPNRTTTPAFTGVTLKKTRAWAMSPDFFRAAYPTNLSSPVPLYRTSDAQPEIVVVVPVPA